MLINVIYSIFPIKLPTVVSSKTRFVNWGLEVWIKSDVLKCVWTNFVSKLAFWLLWSVALQIMH